MTAIAHHTNGNGKTKVSSHRADDDATHLNDQANALAEAAADAAAVNRVLEGVQSAKTVDEAAKIALDLARDAFGWAYGSYWKVDPADNALHWVLESGEWGFGGETRGKSADLPSLLGDLARK